MGIFSTEPEETSNSVLKSSKQWSTSIIKQSSIASYLKGYGVSVEDVINKA